MSGFFRNVPCSTCKQVFSQLFLFYRTWSWPLCRVYCQKCGKEIKLPASIYFLAGFIWVISASITSYLGTRFIIFITPEFPKVIVGFTVLIIGLVGGGFFGSQIILQWISKHQK